MESRFRKLLSTKRSRANSQPPDLDLNGVPYPAAASAGRIPQFFNNAFGRKSSTPAPNDLSTLSYDSTVPGRPPTRVDRPERGNGPVKLQTSRRLSSGELLVTEQDYDRTLEDIRQGEYIVGGKQRRVSQISTNLVTAPPSLKFISTAPNSPREQQGFNSSLLLQPASVIVTNNHSMSVDFTASPISLPEMPRHASLPFTPSTFSQPHFDHHFHANSLRRPASSQHFRPGTSCASIHEVAETSSPTIKALYKAEYSRLNSLYSSVNGERTGREIDHDEMSIGVPMLDRSAGLFDPNYSPTSATFSQSSHLPRDLPRRGSALRATASVTNLELGPHDDSSDRSSNKRISMLSSCDTTSSFTTRTSVTDDPSVTREDLRKIVDDMRLTYLNAIEASTPPLQLLPESPNLSKKTRSQKGRSSIASNHSADASRASSRRQSSDRTKSWQSANTTVSARRSSVSSPTSRSSGNRKSSSSSTRRTSHPVGVGAVATLPAIEASPSRTTRRSEKEEHPIGLKRADSTTLGSMEQQIRILHTPASGRPSPAISNCSSPAPGSLRGNSPSPSRLKTRGSKRLTGTSSIQTTPEKRKSSLPPPPPLPFPTRPLPPLPTEPAWQVEAARLFADADADADVDADVETEGDTEVDPIPEIDSFESLCDSIFNPAATLQTGSGFVAFDPWGKDSHATDADPHAAKPVTSTNAPNQLVGLGLGLTVVTATAAAAAAAAPAS